MICLRRSLWVPVGPPRWNVIYSNSSLAASTGSRSSSSFVDIFASWLQVALCNLAFLARSGTFRVYGTGKGGFKFLLLDIYAVSHGNAEDLKVQELVKLVLIHTDIGQPDASCRSPRYKVLSNVSSLPRTNWESLWSLHFIMWNPLTTWEEPKWEMTPVCLNLPSRKCLMTT